MSVQGFPIWGGALDGRTFYPVHESLLEKFGGPDGWYIFHELSHDYRFSMLAEEPVYLAQAMWPYMEDHVEEGEYAYHTFDIGTRRI